MDPEGYRYDQLVLDRNTITAKEWVNVFGKKRLMGLCSFTVRFTKIMQNVALGVIESDNKEYASHSSYRILYWSNNGGYKVGEIVTVLVDLY